MIKQDTKENAALIWSAGQGAAETTIGLPEILSLFHALAGLCVGWLCGALHGALAGIIAALGGCCAGLIAGFLTTRLPQTVNAATSRICRKHKLMGAFFAISGHLVWISLGAAFWWSWLSLLHR
jgi:hypothetical protein